MRQASIVEGFGSLDDEKTWVLSNDSLSTPLLTLVILTVKLYAEGSVRRFKVRVVVGGNFQDYQQDYLETYGTVFSSL